MAKFKISHPRLPQLNGYSLEGPDGKQPTEEDLWFVAKQIVRPYGISQLTDEEKVSAWKNGFFEENQNMQGRESKVLEGLGELVKDAGVRFLQGVNLATGGNISPALKNISPLVAFDPLGVTGGPVGKLIKLPDQAIDYKKTENAEQFKEAGKLLYGLLDNTEDLSDLPDMVAEALKQSGMPFYANNKGARGRVKAAALDYAEKALVSGLAEGGVRGASTSQFLGRGANYLANALEVGAKDMVGMLDDSDILDLVNSEIKYDQSMQQYEDAADMGAMILENPGIAAKSLVSSVGEALTLGQIDDKDIFEVMGGDVNDITQESELLKDLRSGFVQPDQGISFMTEILADPLNAGTGTVAKGLTFPQRVALSGTIKKTLSEVAVLNKKLAPLLKGLEKMPAEALVRNRVAQAAKPLMDELAQKQAILDKFGRNSLTARFAAQASPAELLKQASKIADNTAAGKMTMDMVYSAMKPAGKMSLARKGVMQAMKLNPEIAGATLGFALGGGVPGMVAGAMLPSMLKGARFLSVLPQEVALRFIMRSAADAGQEITEAQAMRQWRMTTNAALYGTGILGLGSLTFGESGNASSLLGGALAVKTLPKLAKFADGLIRDARVVGSEMIFAQTTKEAGPFFNRLAMLPGAEEGLIGANKDRLQMLNAPSGNFFTKPIEPFFTGAKTASKRVGKMTSEFRAGGVGKQPVSGVGKQPVISEATRNLARFLDNNPMLGRSIEAVGRAGENLAVASALPAALGFVGAKGDVEGAVAGAAISLPFTMAGVGVGQYQKFKNKGELFEQAIGDLHYYREHLTKDEQVAFDRLPMGHRMGISKYSISHPDVVIRPGKEGQGNWHFDEAIGQSIIEYNPSTGEGLFDGLLAHEVGHHIEIHGLTPMINKIYFGDPVTAKGGVYGKYDADGNIVTNEEFNAIRDYYNRALIGDESISESDRRLNQQDLGRTTSEIFAEQVKDYLLSGKKEKGRTAVEKIIRSASDAMMGTSFVRDFLMKIGRPLDGNGKFVEEGFFQGMKSIGKGVKIKRIPEITKLIDKYYSDTRGLRKREIQGDPKKAPGEVPIDRSIRKEGKRPIDQDFDTAFTTEDQNNPAIQAILNTGGLFKWRINENGEAEVQKGPTGAPLRYTAGELKKEQAKQADHAVKIFKDSGIEILYDKNGKPYTNEINNLTPEMIDQLAQGPWHPRQIQTLQEISRSLREGDGERAGFLIGYFAASTGRKPKAVPFKYRHEMPYAFRMTKDGNLLVMLHDVDQLQRNLQFLKNWKNLPSEYQQLFGSDNEVWQAFNLYRNNTAKGLKGELDLDPNENRAILKKNFLNALHGGITQQQVALNPLLDKIGYKIASRNTRRGFGAATKSFRIDRVFDVKRSGMQSSPANVDRLKALFMPRESKGRNKKILLRTTDEIAESIKAEAKARGISANDVYNERLAKQLPPEQGNLQPKTPQKENDITLTSEELRLLKKTNIGPEDAEAYRQAVEKRRKLAEASILGEKLFMPTIEERKASKYGKQLSEAQRLDKSIISDARKEWNELGYEAPNFQRFMKLEDEFGADPPALATLQNNGNFKPQELYYVGDMGVAKNANYDAVINIRKRLFDEVDRQESHRWNEDETITVTTDRKKARELQKKLDPDHVPLVLASNAKYIFDPSNPEHIASLKLPEGESFSTNPVDVSLFEPEIKARGWHGYRVGDEISIFDSTRLKLIKDQSAETKLFSKDRPFGKVSGLFGQKTPLDRFDSSTSKDLRFMPLSEEIKARNEWLSKTFSSKNFQDFITRKGKPNFALKNKDGDYLPVPWYHGGTIGIKSKIENKLLDKYMYSFEPNLGKLKDWTFKEDITWLSSDKEFAREYTPPALEIGDQNPIMVATNISNVFDYNNPKHIKILKENTPLDYYQVENIKVGEWRDIEPHLGLLYQLGFDGARMKEQGKFWSREPAENVAIFNRQDIKLIKDVNDVGRSVEVSGKFIGEQLFLPQLKFDFDGKGSAVEMSPVSKDRAPTFWKLFKINPKDPKVYDKVADVLIDTGTPSNDAANALDHAGKLGLDPKKLRQAMARAQRRYFNQIGRFYMPTAYHGTPHTFAPEPGAPFGKFRTSAIGTGEGAQAYGHGLYFAGKKEVAEHYRKVLSGDKDYSYLDYDGISFDRSNPRHEAARRLLNAKRDNKTRSSIIDQIDDQLRRQNLHPSIKEKLREVSNVLQNKDEAKVSGQGSLYKVELAPKENEYLLWDKPLSEQPKGVREKLAKARKIEKRVLGAGVNKKEAILNVDDKFTKGGDVYKELATALTRERGEQDIRKAGGSAMGEQDALASQFLKEAGIPGIKYLDGSSRSKGEGDYNYVIFDEADVTVTDKLFMPAPTDLQARKNMQTFLKANGEPFFAEKTKAGYKPQVLFHRGKIGEKIIHDFDDKYLTTSLAEFKEKLGDKQSWEFLRPTGAGSKFFKDHFGMQEKDAIYTSENLGGRFSDNYKTKEGKWRKFKGDRFDPVNELPDDTIRVITNISKVWDYENVKDVEKVLKEVEEKFTTPKMFEHAYGDMMKLHWLENYGLREALKYRSFMVKFLDDFNLFDKYRIDKSKLLSDDQYLKEVQDGLRRVQSILERAGTDIAVMKGIHPYRTDYWLSNGEWSNEALIPVIESLGYEGMRNLDADSGSDLPSKSVLIFDSKNIKLVHGKGFKNYGTFDPNNPDIRYMPASKAGAPKRQPANRITRQAPAMPGNRFMLPAASAGAKSAERFR